MEERQKKRISKFISLVLRHRPELIGIDLDHQGWAKTQELIEKSKSKDVQFTIEDLNEIVITNDKKHFSFNEDGTKIRANQGHSLKYVDLEMKPIEPPAILYHGTVVKFIDSIKKQGLIKRSRQHVHLSLDIETANKVGSRRGVPVILEIEAQKMYAKGFKFYCSANGVWLTDHIPAEFIIF
jgi:putative RNA 2'-phosphotransferase